MDAVTLAVIITAIIFGLLTGAGLVEEAEE
jgi:hypothetical protein